ncbi:oxidoreductase [Sphingomonas melonis]|nr:GPW/gp25 family protein [Sphingomonas melonis]ATI54497.1 oxidoreductase [Sphingomonas melonis]
MIGMDRHTGRTCEGADHLRQSIADILGTPVGTRVGRRDYGSRIPELLDQPLNDATRIRVFAAAAMALLRHERRARVQRIALAAGTATGTATLTITGRRTDAIDAGFTFSTPVTALGALA